MTEKLLVIDGFAILHRAFHALPPLTNSKGEMVNAVYGFMSMLLNLKAQFSPQYLVIAFDTPKRTFRNELYENYQAKRPEMKKELSSQIKTVRYLIEKMGIKLILKDGFEADDVIGTIAKKITEGTGDIEMIIATGDRDLLQLVNEKVKVYLPIKGLSKGAVYSINEVMDKYGLPPGKIVDYKGLTGDQSDNYPGVMGIGPKTAKDLIEKWGSVENIYENIDKLKEGKIKEALITYKKDAIVSKKLAQIVCDVPIDFSLKDSKLPDWDNINVHLVFDRLEFRTLIPRLGNKSVRLEVRGEREEKKEEKEKKKENINVQTRLF